MGKQQQKIQEVELKVESFIIEGQTLDKEGHEVRVTIIAGGTSKNGFAYDQNALQSIAQMMEGAKAYADHARTQADQSNRSIRDVVGFYRDAEYIPENGGRVDATLHIFEASDWLWSMIAESVELGRPELVGLSIDIFGQWQHNESTKAKHVTSVVSLNSCDIVTRPSAGGAFRRILHDDSPSDEEGEPQFPTTPPQGEQMDPTTTTATTNAATQAQQATTPVHTPTLPTTIQESAQAPATSSQILEQQQILEAQRVEAERMFQQMKLERAGLTLDRRLQESILPAPVKENIKAKFTARVFEDAELDAEMTAALNMMAQLTRDGLVRGNGYDKASISGQITEAEKVQAAFDGMFDLDVDQSKFAGVRGFTSIREAYARVTGDASLMGGISGASNIGNIRVSESAPMGRITEADTTTASFSYLLDTSMNKRLLKDYQAWPAEWQRFVTIAPVRDFKQQSRVRFGAFGSLPIVAEDSAYTAVTLTDSAATYVPQKRGNLVTVSREVIINDDLMAVKQIPTKLAVAAAYTLAEFVYAFLSSNPNIYDGSALFTTGAPHSNLGAAALSTGAMQTGITSMREQTNYAGKRIGLRPRFLVVPAELEWQAMVVTKSAGVPGSPNNDINPMLGYLMPIVSPQLASATQWFLIGDPREIDTIEIGFVGGQVNPALFIQDSPLLGLNFTQDSISYKVRHEYGGTAVDYRGLYRGI